MNKKCTLQVCFFVVFLLGVVYNPIFGQSLPRPEYPRPQFERKDWINLNGEWTYQFDFGKSGTENGFTNSKGFPNKIIVPFCPESKLSGVGYTDFINSLWYQRSIKIPETWNGKKVILHFGGVDYQSRLYIDGILVGKHWGGTSSFSFDITKYIQYGHQHNLVLSAIDDIRSKQQPSGKQSISLKSAGCNYTRTTGIWQTVWLEDLLFNQGFTLWKEV